VDVGPVDGNENETDVSLTDIVEAKYYYAGGSARFMFEFELSKLKDEIYRRFQSVGENNRKYFANGAVSPSTPSSVNSLMQQFRTRLLH